MRRIWAIARQMIAEGVRMKIALLFIGVLVVLLIALPLTLAGDGVTLTSRVQSFLTYSLSLATFLLSLLTVFLACATIAGEIRGKQIILTATKPIPRWQFFFGKWLGIVVLNAVLLLITGASVWATSAILARRPTTVPDDRERLRTEVMAARFGVKVDKPDLNEAVEERLRKLREEGRVDKMTAGGENDLRIQIAEDISKGWWSIKPMETRDFNFKGLLVDRTEGNWLHLRVKPLTPVGTDDMEIVIAWFAGNRDDMNTVTQVQQFNLVADRWATIPIPAWAVDKSGTLSFHIANLDPDKTLIFESDANVTLYYDLGTFHWNLFRALSLIWCQLAFLAALGLLMSTFLSFPVGVMACALVLLVATMSGFLQEAIDAARPNPSGEDPMWIFGPILRPLAYAFVWMVPDFSKFDPIGNVADGQVVPLMWVIKSVAQLVLMQGLVLGVIGASVFTKRELAQVVV